MPPPAMGRVLATAALNKETWGGSTDLASGFFFCHLCPSASSHQHSVLSNQCRFLEADECRGLRWTWQVRRTFGCCSRSRARGLGEGGGRLCWAGCLLLASPPSPSSHRFNLFLSFSCSSCCSFPTSDSISGPCRPGSPCGAAQPCHGSACPCWPPGPCFSPCGSSCGDPSVFCSPPAPCPSAAGPSYHFPSSSPSSTVPDRFCSPRISRACPS